jgi:2-polyprenyl-3-methyl-5-hydroxy-6-metoxy-1,4-benzoquinol methylase
MSEKEPSDLGTIFSGVAHAAKYNSGNWIADNLVKNFLRVILRCVVKAGNSQVHEIGCGEGHILAVLARHGFEVRGSDISRQSLSVARTEAARHGLDFSLQEKSIYDLDFAEDGCKTVLCCEVLEHLMDPELGLQKLLSICQSDLILSVPREPIWHILNMCRGKYWYALGNTPGHFQHWTTRMFVDFVKPHADIVSVQTPLPWTVIHCRPKPR